jgi:hypothetical protein
MDHKEPYHDYCGPSRTFVSRPLVLILGEDDSDDDVASGHADSADNENGFPTNLVDVENGRDGSKPHDNADNTTCQ